MPVFSVFTSPSRSRARSRGQRKSLALDLDKNPSDPRHMAIEVRSLRRFEIGKKPADPRCQMPLEHSPLRVRCGGEGTVDEARHDLAENGRVILGFRLAVDALDLEALQVLAQPRQGTLVEKSGQIKGRIGQELAAPDADEQIEEFALERRGIAVACRFGESGMRLSE